MKAKRLTFAKKHQIWTAKEWGKLIFCDESTLQQFVVKNRHDFFDETFAKSDDWGAVLENGVAGLFFLPHGTTMNGPRYVELLEEKLKIHMTVQLCKL